MKKTTVGHIMIKLLKTSDKEKELKAARDKRHIYTQGNKYKSDSRLLIRNYASQEKIDQCL